MKLNRLSTVITVLAAATLFDLLSVTKPASAVDLLGLTTDNTLVGFDSSNPTATSSVQVTGVTGTLLGIDRRPSNNLIYGLTTTNNIYTIDRFTGAATFVSTLSIPFTGGNISGVDFNPVPDLLRVVGGNDQNLRINVTTGSVATNVTPSGDLPLNPNDPNITAAAYTNADTDPATGTVLYDIDYVADALFIQNPPNNGTLTNAVVGGTPGTPVGSLGIDIDATAGFDIFTANGVNTAFAALTPAGTSGSNLYTINLTSGAATLVDTIGGGRTLIGLTAVVPEPNIGVGSLFGIGALALWSCYRRRPKSID